MLRTLSGGSARLILIAFCLGRAALAGELTSTLDLISSDAAFCLEVPHLNDSWTRIESDPVIDRIRSFPPLQRLLESQGFQHWQAVDDRVSRLTGSRLSSQLRSLFGNSLVLAIEVPATGQPRGILLGEAVNADAIQTALATWSKLEPNGVLFNKSHHGRKYFERKRKPNVKDSAYIAIYDRWFAVSDQESMIHDVIDRFVSLGLKTSEPDASERSLSHSRSFVRNRSRLKSDAVAFVHINARPWDRGLEESSQGSNDPIKIPDLWKHVDSVAACLRIDRGIVCDAVIDLNSTHLPMEWSTFVSTARPPSTWIPRMPANALLAVAGRCEIGPAIRFVLNQIPSHDRMELSKIRRVAQSFFGGHDVLEMIIPELVRDFGGFITTRIDERDHCIKPDVAMGFSLNEADHARLMSDIDHGLNSGLSLLAAFQSVEGPVAVTVERTQSEAIRTRSLSKEATIPAAYRISGDGIVIAGSRTLLENSFGPSILQDKNLRLADDSERCFAGMNQLVWIDLAQSRRLLEQHGPDLARFFSPGSSAEAKRISDRFEQSLPYLGSFDSVFLAGRIESDHVRIVLGASLESRRLRPRE